MTGADAIIALAAASAVFNLVLCWRLARRARALAVLQMLLAQLCVAAFHQQHLPIWAAFGAAFGARFKITVIDEDQWRREKP